VSEDSRPCISYTEAGSFATVEARWKWNNVNCTQNSSLSEKTTHSLNAAKRRPSPLPSLSSRSTATRL